MSESYVVEAYFVGVGMFKYTFDDYEVASLTADIILKMVGGPGKLEVYKNDENKTRVWSYEVGLVK